MLAEEAYRVLNDEVERSNYDLILERKAKGLPTDPVLVLEADELFRKGRPLFAVEMLWRPKRVWLARLN